jgi:uncharacterized RDD family membrane protein YckC
MSTPAGFWRRYAAYSLDAAALVLLVLPLAWWLAREGAPALAASYAQLQFRLWELFDVSLSEGGDPFAQVLGWARDPTLRDGMSALVLGLLWPLLTLLAALVALAAAWFIASESSRWQASPGKRAFGLRVTDADGGRCGPGRIALRFVAGAPSWLFLHLGHAMAGWTRDKRALHDMLSKTRVELAPGASPAFPRLARSWLLLQAAGFFGLAGFVVLRYVQLLWEIAAAGSS